MLQLFTTIIWHHRSKDPLLQRSPSSALLSTLHVTVAGRKVVSVVVELPIDVTNFAKEIVSQQPHQVKLFLSSLTQNWKWIGLKRWSILGMIKGSKLLLSIKK